MPSSVSFSVTAGGNSVAGTTSFNSLEHGGDVHAVQLAGGGYHYTATISGAQDSSGDTMSSPYTYTFTTSTGVVRAVPVLDLAGWDAVGRGGCE